jgi:ferredoxin-type protein NapH
VRTLLGMVLRWAWARRLCAAGFATLLILGSYHGFPWVKGSMTATTIAGRLRLADPLATLEVALASRSAPTSLLLGAALLVGFAAILGRVFCGWVCPFGLVTDLNHAVRTRLQRLLGCTPGRSASRIPAQTKYFLLGLALGISLIARLPAFQLISPINILVWSAVFARSPELWVIVGILLVEWASPRVWCRALCPLGALYSLIGHFGLLRVRISHDPTRKASCRQCTIRCPMGIRVMEDYVLANCLTVGDPECTRCGTCVDACPQGSLELGFAGSFLNS